MFGDPLDFHLAPWQRRSPQSVTDKLASAGPDRHLPSMSNISNIALSALRAADMRFAARAENIANANTQDYRLQTPEQISTAVGPVVRISRAETARAGEKQPEPDLAREITDLISIKYDYKAAMMLLRTEDEMNGKLLDILPDIRLISCTRAALPQSVPEWRQSRNTLEACRPVPSDR